ncbi:MAG: calcium/sodium antiporter [Anaerolineae bacterium]|nr:calcium/sodium antiporter [Anaerolineae bacterium]
MLLHIMMIGLGVGGLLMGGNWLVKSAARLASSYGASVLVIGLTVVAWATSAPELIVSLSAALQGSSAIALGNVIGSNIVNIGLCLAIMGLMFPVKLSWNLIRREIPLMIGAGVLAFLLSLDGVLSRLDGLILFLCFLGFSLLVYILVRRERRQIVASLERYEQEEGLIDKQVNRLREVGRLAAGLTFLIVGANLTVDGATAIAKTLGISEFVIGLTLVAFGTSLPEFAASLVAAVHHQSDIAVGNVIGSNIANLLGILGVTALVQPIPVTPNSLQVQIPVMIGFSVLVLLLSFGSLIGRWKAAVMLMCYIGFVALTFVGQT